MSDEDFLRRWSRRKREAEKPQPPTGEPAVPPKPEAPPAAVAEAAEPVDLASLPSLESITASTDITAFLRPGVPEELTRSALRKMWTSDPAIRDFIGIAENQWDFNDPASIPGFGEIGFSPEQVRQMAARLVGDVERAADNVAAALAPPAPQETDTPQETEMQNAALAPADIPNSTADDAGVASQNTNVAPQQEEDSRTETVQRPARARRHGGALPT